MNHLIKTWILLVALSLAALVIGFWWDQMNGMTYGVVISLSIILFVFFWGDSQSAHLVDFQELEGSDPWGLLSEVNLFSQKAGIPTPKVFIIKNGPPQSMALGRSPSHGKIFLTQNVLDKLDTSSRQALLAYHTASIKRHETFRHNVASCLSSLPILTVILSPLGWLIIKFCVRHNHYFQTDQLAAHYLGDTKTLALTLWKLNSYSQAQPLNVSWRLAPLFIVNPLTHRSWSHYFSFHPHLEKRIKKLTGRFPI